MTTPREYARILLRNTTTRKDAAYVVVVVDTQGPNNRPFEVRAYYGPWKQYQMDPVNLSKLKYTVKNRTKELKAAEGSAQIVARAKRRNGYADVWIPEPPEPEIEDEDWAYGDEDSVSEPTDEEIFELNHIEREPEPIAVEDSFVSRLKKRTR